MNSLQKKIKEMRKVSERTRTSYMVIDEVLEELGVVAQKIREMKGIVTLDDDDNEKDVLIGKKAVLGLLVEEVEKDDGVSKRLLRISKREK